MIATSKLKLTELIACYNEKIIAFPHEELSDGLVQGKLGLIVYLLMMYEQKKEEVYVEKITAILSLVFKSLENPQENSLLSDSSFAEGVSGLGWVMQLLIEKEILDEEYEAQIIILNEIAFEYAQKNIVKNNFDFLNGSIGVLKFLEKSKNKILFNQLVDTLYDLALNSENLFKTASSDPYISDMNFGFPHGYLSIIKILLNAQLSFGTQSKYQFIIDKCIAKIMSHIDEDHKIDGIHIYKPHKIYYKNEELIAHQNNRLAWCNSDVSWIYLLSKIDYQNKESKYKTFINTVGDNVVKRKKMNVTGIENYHFCHGSSGVAQLFSELYKITEDEKYKEAHQYWVAKTLAYLEDDLSKEITVKDMSLYYGKLGALLMLCDHQGIFPQDWKEVFLIN